MSEAEGGQVRSRGARPARLSPVPEQVQPFAGVQEVVVLPTTINLTFYEGDDFYLDMTVTDSTGPIDLTNSQPMSQIRITPDDDNILASFDIVIDGTTQGLLHLHLNALDSNGLPAHCAWDIQLSNPAITTIAAGTVTVKPQVTQ